MINYKGVKMTKIEIDPIKNPFDKNSMNEEIILVVPKEEKSIKVVHEHPSCPIFENVRCQYSKITTKDMTLTIECTDFDKCPIVNSTMVE